MRSIVNVYLFFEASRKLYYCSSALTIGDVVLYACMLRTMRVRVHNLNGGEENRLTRARARATQLALLAVDFVSV